MTREPASANRPGAKLMVVDPRGAGCSGDMFLAALTHLLGSRDTLSEFVEKANRMGQFELCSRPHLTVKGGIEAIYLSIEVRRDIDTGDAASLIRLMDRLLAHLSVSDAASTLSRDVMSALLEAESAVHGKPVEALHLHETASADTLLDIAGTVYLLEKKGLLGIPVYGLPVNTGSGFVTFSHGTMPVPPPAVLNLLEAGRYPFFSDGVNGELLTPTGAALLTRIAGRPVTDHPPIRVTATGYGAGKKDLPFRPNVLRISTAEVP